MLPGTPSHGTIVMEGRSLLKYALKSCRMLMAPFFVAFGLAYAADQGHEELGHWWEPLLWGGLPSVAQDAVSTEGRRLAGQASKEVESAAPESISQSSTVHGEEPDGTGNANAHMDIRTLLGFVFEDEGAESALSAEHGPRHGAFGENVIKRPVLGRPILENIPPLYTNPELPREGVWDSNGLPLDRNGDPLIYKTSYRPSEKYPNAIVHMIVLDMARLDMRLYVGSSEPGASAGSSSIASEEKPRLVAITNGLWKQKHSGQAGTIYSGQVIRDLFPGMATLAIYKDGSVDVLEWEPDIPLEFLEHAKQLRHLIVKDGRVVNNVTMAGQVADSEIGLGYLLYESEPMPGYQYWGNWWGQSSALTTSGPEWFIATRSAFGVRPDGNLVFAVGHHISTKDLAKALVLAGCDRAIHGDANPHNVLGNVYFPDGNGGFSKKERLSPDQKTYTLDRYVEKSYTSDFFAFFRKHD